MRYVMQLIDDDPKDGLAPLKTTVVKNVILRCDDFIVKLDVHKESWQRCFDERKSFMVDISSTAEYCKEQSEKTYITQGVVIRKDTEFNRLYISCGGLLCHLHTLGDYTAFKLDIGEKVFMKFS